MAKTQAELDEENAKKEREKNILGSIFDFLNPFKNFGNLLMIGLVALGGYLLLGGGKITDMLGGLMDKIPDLVGKINPEWGDKVRGWIDGLGAMMGAKGKLGEMLEKMDSTEAKDKLNGKVPTEALNALTSSSEVWRDFVKTTKDANGGVLSKPEDLTNANSIVALITKKPALVATLLSGLAPKGNKPLSAEEKQNLQPYLATAKEIINGPQFDELLSNANRAKTLGLLIAIKPDIAKDATALEAQLKAVKMLDKDGKPTQALRTVLTNAITDMKMPEVTDIVKASGAEKNPAAMKTIVDAAQPQLVAAVGQANVQQFRSTIGDAKIVAFAATPENQRQNFVMRADNLPAFKAFADSANIAALPKDMQAPITQLRALPKDALLGIVNNGVSPTTLQAIFTQPNRKTPTITHVMYQLEKKDTREIIADAGLGNVAQLMAASAPAQYKALLTEQNLTVMHDVAQKLDNAAKGDLEKRLSRNVVAACLEMVSGNNTLFAKLTPEQLSSFFKKPENNAAIRELLNGIRGLSGKDAAALAALKHQWGRNANEGIGEVLADVEGAKFLKEQMLDTNKSSGKDSKFETLVKKGALYFEGGKVRENSDFLIAYGNEIANGTSVSPNVASTTRNSHAIK